MEDPSSVNQPFWKSPPQNQNKLLGEYNFSNKSKSYFQQRNQGYNIYNKGNYKNQGKYDSRESSLLQDSISILKGEVTICSRTGIKVILEKQLLNLPIAERLKHFLNAWQILTGDLEVLAIVKDYHVPFLCQPHQRQILTKIKV